MRAKQARNANPYLASTSKSGQSAAVPTAPAPGGISSPGIHPLLAQNATEQTRSSKDRYKPMAPKFATIKVSQCLDSIAMEVPLF
jgi:U4/U6 small nuclear ribonucleoprotein PRP3